jgi:hypothetical protein
LTKAVTLLLLSLFLFNVMGYYGVYLGLRYQSNQQLKADLDAGRYTEDQTITIKIPYLLPYQMEFQGFERVDGEFEKDGEFYKLVKHKVERDTLYIMYMKDHKEASLYKFLTGFVHSNSNTPTSKTALKFIENFVKDYIAAHTIVQTTSNGWCRNTDFNSNFFQSLIQRDSPVFSPPPNLL